MTRISDIDAQAVVTKFLGKDTTNEGTIESIATAMLLNPQIPISFILKARNRLSTFTTKQITLVKNVLEALDFVNNPEVPVTGEQELTNAKIALIQLDKLGRLTNATLENYQTSIDNFVNNSLNRSKSGDSTKFSLSQIEAKEDVYIGLAGFILYHRNIIDLIKSIIVSVDNFNKTDLSKIVSQRVINKLKQSVTDVSDNINDLSKISMVIELLAGKAVLTSISSPRSITGPVVETKVLPIDTNIQIISERISAKSTCSTLPLTVGSDNLGITTNGIFVSADYPLTAARGRCFITSYESKAVYNIPANSALFVKVFYNSPAIIGPVGPAPDTIQINLTAGLRTFNEIVTEIGNGLSAPDLAAGITTYGGCTSFAKNGSNIIMIYGVTNVTGFQIIGLVPGTYVANVYTYPRSSAHEVLGFKFDQIGTSINTITTNDLNRFINLNFPGVSTFVNENRITVSTLTTTETSSLTFSGIGPLIGFTNSTPIPTYLTLMNNSVPILTDELDVHSGYHAIVNGRDYTINRTELSNLYVNIPITPIGLSSVNIYSDTYYIISSLIYVLAKYETMFDLDIFNFEQVVGPILTSNPSLAQVADCKRVLNNVLTNLELLNTSLELYILDNPKSISEDMSKEILFMLESRNMNNLIDLLLSCKFLEFFSTTIDKSSSGTTLMSAIEDVGKKDLIV